MSLRSEDGRPLKSKNPIVIGKDGTTLLEPNDTIPPMEEGSFPSWASPLLIIAGGIGLAFGIFFLWLIATFLAIYVLFSAGKTLKRR